MNQNLKNIKNKSYASLLLGLFIGGLGITSVKAIDENKNIYTNSSEIQNKKLSIKEKCDFFEQKSYIKENENLPDTKSNIKKIDKKILESAEKNIPLKKNSYEKFNKPEILNTTQINDLFPIDNEVFNYYLNVLRSQEEIFNNPSNSSIIIRLEDNSKSEPDDLSESSHLTELNKKLGIEKKKQSKEKNITISDIELSYLQSLDPSLREVELNQILKNRKQKFGIVHNSSAKTEKAFIASLKLIYEIIQTESNCAMRKLVSALPAMSKYVSEIGEHTEFNQYAVEFFSVLLKNVKNYLYNIDYKKKNISMDFESQFKKSFTIESMKDYPGADKSNSLKSSIKNIEVLGKIIPKCHYDIKIKSSVGKIIKENTVNLPDENILLD